MRNLPARYVMFGQSMLLGDYVEIIRAGGGVLEKIVLNLPPVAEPKRKAFSERLDAINRQAAAAGQPEVAVWDIAEFRPAKGECYVIGFRGTQLVPLRERLAREHHISFASLVHPRAVVSPSARVAEGVIVNAGAVVASDATLMEFSLVNRGATIGHDTEVGAYARVGPGANLASHVRVGRDAVIGIGATVIEHVAIGEHAYVAAGAVVIRDVAPGDVVAGVPARVVKRRDEIRGS